MANYAAAGLRKPLRRGGQRGFALALTLWILAAIMVAAAIFSDRVRQAVSLAQRQQQNTDALLDIAASQAEILFRLAVTPMSYESIDTLSESCCASRRELAKPA